MPASLAAAPTADIDSLHAPSLSLDAATRTGQTVDLTMPGNVQFSFLIPKNPQAETFAATSGVWRPLESIALRAEYGIAERAAAAERLGCGNALPCLQAVGLSPSTIETYSLGASWRMNERFSLEMDYLNRQTDAPGMVGSVPWIGTRISSFSSSASALGGGNAEALDISLTCDIDAGSWGDLELGLQVSRVINQSLELGGQAGDSPYTEAAFGVGWQRGAFRGDLTSRYLDVINQTDDPTGWTSFDVNFAWRTPWKASVSVGARNVLNNPAPASNNLSDSEVENFFGRVPYVRYQQDL